MLIWRITIIGVGGRSVEIARTEDGALVTRGNDVICEVRRDDDPEERFRKATAASGIIYGYDGRGKIKATNSMVHDVLREIERVAGC